jgi:hypothetical protein
MAFSLLTIFNVHFNDDLTIKKTVNILIFVINYAADFLQISRNRKRFCDD